MSSVPKDSNPKDVQVAFFYEGNFVYVSAPLRVLLDGKLLGMASIEQGFQGQTVVTRGAHWLCLECPRAIFSLIPLHSTLPGKTSCTFPLDLSADGPFLVTIEGQWTGWDSDGLLFLKAKTDVLHT